MHPDTLAVVRHSRHTLPLADARLAPEYTYAHLPLAITDAVYSIGVTYQSTRNTVERLAAHLGLERFSTPWPPREEEQLGVGRFLDRLGGKEAEDLANEVFQNRQRTSSHPTSRLKAEAVMRFARVLAEAGIEHFQDLTPERFTPEVERRLMEIPGQRSGVSLFYFKMLTGSTLDVKPDRMVVRFIEEALGRKVTAEEARVLLIDACSLLVSEHPHLNPRLLDYLVWQFQRGKPDLAAERPPRSAAAPPAGRGPLPRAG